LQKIAIIDSHLLFTNVQIVCELKRVLSFVSHLIMCQLHQMFLPAVIRRILMQCKFFYI